MKPRVHGFCTISVAAKTSFAHVLQNYVQSFRNRSSITVSCKMRGSSGLKIENAHTH
jgi:hypothetical protein